MLSCCLLKVWPEWGYMFGWICWLTKLLYLESLDSLTLEWKSHGVMKSSTTQTYFPHFIISYQHCCEVMEVGPNWESACPSNARPCTAPSHYNSLSLLIVPHNQRTPALCLSWPKVCDLLWASTIITVLTKGPASKVMPPTISPLCSSSPSPLKLVQKIRSQDSLENKMALLSVIQENKEDMSFSHQRCYSCFSLSQWARASTHIHFCARSKRKIQQVWTSGMAFVISIFKCGLGSPIKLKPFPVQNLLSLHPKKPLLPPLWYWMLAEISAEEKT